MDAPKATTDITLRIERRIAASPERVFAAWTTAEGLKHWFSPTPEHAVLVHDLDLKVGGRYRVEMRHSSGEAHIVIGNYREITPPKRLVFTWQWETGMAGGQTLVTVLIEPDDKGSRMTLLHEKFASEEERAMHNEGWTGCLDRLVAAVS